MLPSSPPSSGTPMESNKQHGQSVAARQSAGGETPGAGFTLIELSIVLVIIGLIVGGVLVGQDLIKAAEVRAQISQIEKYQTAVNTFRTKYNNELPGDMPAADAVMFGLSPSVASRTWAGVTNGNGDGVLQAINSTMTTPVGGEFYLFWQDLLGAGLISDSFMPVTDGGSAIPCYLTGGFCAVPAKITGNGVYAYGGGGNDGGTGAWASTGVNYFGVSIPVAYTGAGNCSSNPGLTVSQAYAIDKKMDDGLPTSGNVIAAYTNMPPNGPSNGYGTGWGAPNWVNSNPGYTTYTSSKALVLPSSSEMPNSGAIPGDGTTCYDNGNSAGVAPQYSMAQNNGAGVNCALSFQFQ